MTRPPGEHPDGEWPRGEQSSGAHPSGAQSSGAQPPGAQLPVMAPTESLPRGRRGFAIAAIAAGLLCLSPGFALLVAPFAFLLGGLALRGDGVARLFAIVGMSIAGAMVLTVLLPVLTTVACS